MSRLEEARVNIEWERKKIPPELLPHIDFLYEQAERAEELKELNKLIKSQTGRNFEVNRKLDAENQRYKKALEFALSELEYAHVTGNMDLRGNLIKNSIKAIDEALESESDV